VQACIVAELKARGYTHVVMGPLVDSDGYHGIWQPNDWRGANFERFLDALQMFWDAGLAPVVFISPDGWTYEQNVDAFTAAAAAAARATADPHRGAAWMGTGALRLVVLHLGAVRPVDAARRCRTRSS
jgi:hypothetical protein